MAGRFPAAGVRALVGEQRLGGFRRVLAGSPDVALRNPSFRGYAAWMRTAEFAAAVDGLLAAPDGLLGYDAVGPP
ncbi:MAG: hypothetical protein ACR2J0_03600 [Mycobacteriales bacterium]